MATAKNIKTKTTEKKGNKEKNKPAKTVAKESDITKTKSKNSAKAQSKPDTSKKKNSPTSQNIKTKLGNDQINANSINNNDSKDKPKEKTSHSTNNPKLFNEHEGRKNMTDMVQLSKPNRVVGGVSTLAGSDAENSSLLAKTNGAMSICSNCSTFSKCRRRTFSEQAWVVLLLWNEISPSAVDQPVCDECYKEMREILIDRTDEIEAAMQQKEEVAKIKEQLHTLAS